MFLRRKTKSARGVGYSYWHLCKTVRTARGPRQQVVASLGKLDQAELAGLRGGWDDLPALLRGEAPPRGYSRDQRSGNKQVCIGLVCTPEGLPLSVEVFAGNRADVSTVEDIVRVK